MGFLLIMLFNLVRDVIAPFVFKALLFYGGLFGVPYLIWRIVRWINRRDDQLYAKRPPGAP